MPKDTVLIANSGGFWGDDPTAARRQIEGGRVDYLVMDYLAEVTMAILQKQRQRNPESGYATDFLRQLRDVLPACIEQGTVIIANAGGVNPIACQKAVEQLAEDLGVANGLRVGVVLGDDIFDDLDTILSSGEELRNLDTDAPLSEIRPQVLSANVYLGALPIARALALGANVVIAGRVTDTALALGPMMYEFGWQEDDWDRLASGIVAGHIIECGAQSTGGNFTDWETVETFDRIGYPIIEAHPDGTFVVTKHPGTGGLVSTHTVGEQLLYEMGGPSYIAPDCVAHFDSIHLSQDGPDRVLVSGIKGEPSPEKLKVSVSFSHGYRIFGRMMISGPEALRKAEKAAEVFWVSAGGREKYEETSTQFIGWNATHPPLATTEPGEVLIQVAARDDDREKLDQDFAPFVVARGLSSVPGFTVPADQGRPRVSDVVGYWPALISREQAKVRVRVGDVEEQVPLRAGSPQDRPVGVAVNEPQDDTTASGELVTVPLRRMFLARSGDKGDTANVGVITRSEAIYVWGLKNLSTDLVADRFKGVCKGPIERFELPNLLSMNFLLHHALGGGGTMSIQFDSQGKTYAQYLLATPVTVDRALLGDS